MSSNPQRIEKQPITGCKVLAEDKKIFLLLRLERPLTAEEFEQLRRDFSQAKLLIRYGDENVQTLPFTVRLRWQLRNNLPHGEIEKTDLFTQRLQQAAELTGRAEEATLSLVAFTNPTTKKEFPFKLDT